MEMAFRKLGEARADNKPRQRPRIKGSMLQFMGAAVDDIGMGLKAYTVTSKGVRFVVLLWDLDSGDLQAVIEANKLGQMRTGAASGVATRYLAREDAETVGIIGSGWQARSQLEAVCSVRSITRVLAYSRNPLNCRIFTNEMSERLGVAIEMVSDAVDVVEEADVLITITNSDKPLFDGSKLRPGTHVNAAGSNRRTAQEIDLEAIERMDLITIDQRIQGQLESGDLIPAIRKKIITWENVIELGAIVAGQLPGRTGASQLTLFESLGIAAEDVAVARIVYDKACEMGAGTPLIDSILG